MARQVEKANTHNEDLNDAEESGGKGNLTTKLERRRRIEDLNEERRLREELSEF